MADITIEEIFNGYCRTVNSSQMVTCEYIRKDDHLWLDHTDCAFGGCVHSSSCEIMKEALKKCDGKIYDCEL